MTVEIVRTNKTDHTTHRIPVATSKAFREDWLPLCEKYGLETIPKLQDPYALDEEMRRNLLQELRTLQTQLSAASEPRQGSIKERITLILSEVERYPCEEYEFILG